MKKNRNYNIDFLKGILIIFVIIGHVVPGTLDQVLIRNIIYSFHMPIFIGIAGYLFPIQKLKPLSFKFVFLRYWNRIIIPWLIAINIYFIINNVIIGKTTSLLTDYFNAYIHPYYHLWFILGFLFYVFLTWFLVKKGWPSKKIIFFSFLISIISNTFLTYPELYLVYPSNGLFKNLLTLIGYDLRLQNYIFFVLGMYFNKRLEFVKKEKFLKFFSIMFFLISLIITIYIFFNNSDLWKITFFTMNIPLLFLLLSKSRHGSFPRNRYLEFIGKNSLLFYLWHMIAVILLRRFITYDNLFFYYLLNVFMVAIESLFIKIFLRIKLERRLRLNGNLN